MNVRKASAGIPEPALQAILKRRGFRVSWSQVPKGGPSAFGRRHFYLILLSIGHSKIHYDDHTLDLDGVYLVLANARVPYATEILSEQHTGYSCVFTEEFIKPLERLESLQQSPLFNLSGSPAYALDAGQQAQLTGLFDAMMVHDASDYLYKDDLMRNYIQLIVHEALHLRPAEHFLRFNNAALRITTLFLDLLERQFPIEDLRAPLQLKTAQDYAARLAIHVNYLNRAVKEVTGKPTTAHVTERITAEATTLLRHTEWSVAEIAYALGFAYPNYFSSFFKKATGHPPKFYRTR